MTIASTSIESLQSLRLPELQSLYAEVTGKATKSPNKKYLIKVISEVLAAQAVEILAEDAAIAAMASAATEPAPVIAEEPAPEPTPVIAEEPAAAAEPSATMEPADDGSATEEPADDQDIATEAMEDEIESFATEAELAGFLAEGTATDDATQVASAAENADTASTAGQKLSKLSVTELQARYLEVVGRPTGSSHKRYLIWKIREAQKGRIPVGQRIPRSATPEGIDAEIKILPLRMESALVEQLDAARERLGLKSRMDLFRKALGAYLAGAGETELAATFSTDA